MDRFFNRFFLLSLLLLHLGGCAQEEKEPKAEEPSVQTATSQGAPPYSVKETTPPDESTEDLKSPIVDGNRMNVQITSNGIYFMKEKVLPIRCQLGNSPCTDQEIQRMKACVFGNEPCEQSERDRLRTMYFFVDARFKKNQDDKAFLIEPLYQVLSREMKRQRITSAPFSTRNPFPSLAFGLEDGIPFRLLMDLVYSAGKADLFDTDFYSLANPEILLLSYGHTGNMEHPAAEQRAPNEAPLHLTVAISPTELTIKQNPALAPSLPSIPKLHNGAGPSEHNFAALHAQLVAIKSQYPSEPSINIAGDRNTPWQDVVRVISTARYKRATDEYSNNQAFFAAPAERNADGVGVILFDRVVFAVTD